MKNRIANHLRRTSDARDSLPAPESACAPEWRIAATLCDGPCPQIHRAGTALYRQGEPATFVFAIDHGIAKLIRSQSDGREVILGLRFPGWLLGVEAAILEESHQASAVTLTRTGVRRIPAARLRGAMRSDPQLSWELHRMQSREVCDQTGVLAGFGSLSARQRLEEFLRALQPLVRDAACPEGNRVRLPLKYCELAQLIRVSPPYLSQLFVELERDGILKREHRSLVFLKSARTAPW